MSKLVDKERLAKLAKALDQRAKAAVAAEKKERVAAESRIEGKADQNAAAIAAINNEENGLLAQAQLKVNALKNELNPKITDRVEESVYSAKVTELESKDSEMAEDILGLDTAIKGINERLGDANLNLPSIDEAIKNFRETQLEVDTKQNQDIVKAQEAADKAQADVDDVVGRLDNEGGIVDRIEAVEAFKQGHSHEELQGEIDALEGRADVLEQFKEAHSHEEMKDAIAALQELHKEGGVVDGKVSEVREAVEGLQSEVTTFKSAQATKDQEQDEAINDKVAKADYETDKKALQAEDARLDQAIKDEASRADAAEKANKALIDAINNADTGILAQAKSHAQGLVDTEKGAREDADEALDERLKVVEASIGNGGELATKVAANEAKLAGLEKDTVKAEIEQAEADAKAYADEKITALVDSAPDAMNTLNELAEAIKGNKGIYDAYIAEHAQAMAKQKEDLQKEIDDDIAAAKVLISAEIDADVKAEADRAKAEEAAIRKEFADADLGLSGRIADLEEMMGVGGEEAGKSALEKIREDITALEQKDADLVKEDVRLAGEIAKKVDQGAYDTKVQALETEDERIAGLVQQAQDEVDAVEIRMGTAEGKITTLEGFINAHSHEAMEDQIELNKQGVADNKAAIEKEVEDRDAAIAEALKAYTNTTDMMTIIGNVVNSLAVTMENNKMVLKLGGKDGIAIHETSLDMATDADIDEIIAGLNSAE